MLLLVASCADISLYFEPLKACSQIAIPCCLSWLYEGFFQECVSFHLQACLYAVVVKEEIASGQESPPLILDNIAKCSEDMMNVTSGNEDTADRSIIAEHKCFCLQLTELALTMPVHRSGWMGLEKIPYSWHKLTNLQRLTLRGHLQLLELPRYFARLPLRVLDIASCPQLNLSALSSFTSLETLLLQACSKTLNSIVSLL